MLGNNNSDRPTRVALYARVSSEEQKEGDTIRTQLDMGRKYCETFGHELVVIYDQDEAVSGTVPLHERPGGALLLEAAQEKRFDVVLVYNVKRLARQLKVLLDAWEDLDRYGVGLLSMTESLDTSSPMGRFVMQLIGGIAELDRETLLEQTRDGKETIVRRGFWPGGRPPMGYSIEHDGVGRGQRRGYLVVNEDEAETIRLIYSLYQEDGAYLYKVARQLNGQSIPTVTNMRTGVPSSWDIGRVQTILRNPLYAGTFVYYRKRNQKGRDLVTGDAPSIIDKDTWKAVQARLDANFKSSRRNMKRFYTLRGIPRCGVCGKACSGMGWKSKGAFYYTCNGLTSARDSRKCSGVRVRADMLEDRIWEDVRGFVMNPGEAARRLAEELGQEQDHSDDVQSKIATVDEAISKVKQQRRWVIDQGKRNAITTEEAASALADTAQELEILESRRKDLEGQAHFRTAQTDYANHLEAMLSDLRDSVENADDETKHWAMQHMVEKIILTPLGDKRVKVEPYYKFSSLTERQIEFSTPRRVEVKTENLELPVLSASYELVNGKGARNAAWAK